jgi:hypothetical protein
MMRISKKNTGRTSAAFGAQTLPVATIPNKAFSLVSRTQNLVAFDVPDSVLLKDSAFMASFCWDRNHTALEELSTPGLQWISDANTASRAGKPVPPIPEAIAHELPDRW